MRDLDRESIELTTELSRLEQAFLERARTRKSSGLPIVVPTPNKIHLTQAILPSDTRFNGDVHVTGSPSQRGSSGGGVSIGISKSPASLTKGKDSKVCKL